MYVLSCPCGKESMWKNKLTKKEVATGTSIFFYAAEFLLQAFY